MCVTVIVLLFVQSHDSWRISVEHAPRSPSFFHPSSSRSELRGWSSSFFISAFFFQCDTSALGGSPSSTLTCSTASPCSESPSSTLNTATGAQASTQPLTLPSPHGSTITSPIGTLSSPLSSPAPCPASRSSPGLPSQSPTSTLESKDSGIIGESYSYLDAEG